MRHKSLIRLSLGMSAIALVAIGGSTLSLYHQLIQIPLALKKTPEIASRFQQHHVLHQGAFATVRKIVSRSHRFDQGRAARLHAEDLNAFFAYALSLNMGQQGDLSILRGTKVEILDNTLKTTALIDLSQVSASSLEEYDRLSLLRRFFKIPGVRNRTIAIAVEGQPTVRNRVLVLDNPIISIGNIQLTTSKAVQWLGVSEAILQERLDKEWGGLPMELERVNILNDISGESSPHLELAGSPTAW